LADPLVVNSPDLQGLPTAVAEQRFELYFNERMRLCQRRSAIECGKRAEMRRVRNQREEARTRNTSRNCAQQCDRIRDLIETLENDVIDAREADPVEVSRLSYFEKPGRRIGAL
jgi:hypothetical protein